MSINDNQQTTNQRYIPIDKQQIPVTEEVYRAYKRPVWAERKRKEREKRCLGEKCNRCTGDCSKCNKQQTGSVLSLDSFIEGSGCEPADAVNIAELVKGKLLLEEREKFMNNNCFAYKNKRCKILKEILCSDNDCPFYKTVEGHKEGRQQQR